MQTCPRCGSNRVRHGYGRERFGLRLIGVRELLCNQCNLSFTRFVIPGTMPKSGRHSKKSGHSETKEPITAEPPIEESTSAESNTTEPTIVEPGQASSRSNGHRHHRHGKKPAKRCPRCDGGNVHRSSRRGIREHTISMFSLYPYRCHDCDQRFYVRRAAR
jgi:transposase-like protein